MLKNPELPSVKPDFPGNRFEKNMFISPYASQIGKTPWPVLKWRFSKNPKAQAKKADTYALTVTKHTQLPDHPENYIMWLGHASFLIRMDGKTLLLDPCLFAPPLFKRFAEVPLDIRSVPVDYVLVSHAHYDHLDAQTVKLLSGKAIRALVPLNMGPLIKKWNPSIAVQEAGWYQQYSTDSDVKIILTPAKHWNKRGLTDFNRILWGSYIIQWRGLTIYFAGDTGYDGHFKEIREIFPSIDVALLPIAAYDPPFIMKDNHMNPAEAIRAFSDLKAKHMIPMHYGTFDLTDEPMGEPIQWFQDELRHKNLENRATFLEVGGVFDLNRLAQPARP